MYKKSRVLFLATVQSDVHQCTRCLVFPLGVTRASPAKVAACIALLVKLVCESITHCALSLSTLCGSRAGILLSSCLRLCVYVATNNGSVHFGFTYVGCFVWVD